MRYVEAPEYRTYDYSLFLAGGITDCPDWQQEMVGLLKQSPATEYLTVYNPRREDFDVRNPNESGIQINWEHAMLRKADAISFWFCEATLCPITLYELGVWSMSRKPIFVGIEPGYKRTEDVIIQTRLIRPEVRVSDTLTDLAFEVENWVLYGEDYTV